VRDGRKLIPSAPAALVMLGGVAKAYKLKIKGVDNALTSTIPAAQADSGAGPAGEAVTGEEDGDTDLEGLMPEDQEGGTWEDEVVLPVVIRAPVRTTRDDACWKRPRTIPRMGGVGESRPALIP
jgi:hypothetical protein